jgi:hypothetical protein
MMIASGNAGRPNRSVAFGTGAEVLAVKFVEAWSGQSQFTGRFRSGKFFVSMAGQNVTNEGRGQTVNQLWLFIG